MKEREELEKVAASPAVYEDWCSAALVQRTHQLAHITDAASLLKEYVSCARAFIDSALRSTVVPPASDSESGGSAADISSEFQSAESLFDSMQQAAAAVVALSHDHTDSSAAASVAADCQQLVDSSRAHASACVRADQLVAFLEDKVLC
jgi:hypothetical protein